MKYKPYRYQDHATQHILNNRVAGLFMEMGLGKTVATLTASDILLYDQLEITKVLIIAPLMVAKTVWTGERDKWDHLRHLTISRVIGDEVQRKEALRKKADIYIINRENVVWLVAQYGTAFPFDMVIFDESSSFKDSSTARFKAIKKVLPLVKRVVILTGTPGDLLHLWSQIYLLDQGQRLGENITRYRDKYFRKKDNGFGYELRKEDKNSVFGEGIYEQEIFDKISDLCISMKSKDYLELPGRIDNLVQIQLPADILKKYLNFEEKQILELKDKEITAVNAGALITKLLQFSNGAVYDKDSAYHVIHEEKLKALEEIIENADGQPVLVFYSFRSDIERIAAALKKYKPVKLSGASQVEDWNKKLIPVMIAHPASAGHGLNLQAGGNIIVWFGPTWSLELYQQANARLDRQGQEKPVIIHHLVCSGTMDEDVLSSLSSKTQVQDAIMKAVKARISKYLVNS